MKVLVGMSGGVDSSVAAAILVAEGHDVVGVTLKLWGGAQDSGCCSVGDVEDARRVAQQLDIAHHVFNFADSFEDAVVTPYVEAHVAGLTPNPCIECNRHIKFDRLMERADLLGFDAVATGHHAVVVHDGRWRLRRGTDRAKDQSYVVHMLTQAQLGRTLFPVGGMTKAEVRAYAARLGLRTAAKEESQDTCFITASGGRSAFLGTRIPLRRATVVDGSGAVLGSVPAVEMVTVGQRRHLGDLGASRLYATSVNVASAVVTVGPLSDLLVDRVEALSVSWVGPEPEAGASVRVQPSAHGVVARGVWDGISTVVYDEPVKKVAPGQAVVLYDDLTGDEVLGGGVAA